MTGFLLSAHSKNEIEKMKLKKDVENIMLRIL